MQYNKTVIQIELEILGADLPNVSSNQINNLTISFPTSNEMNSIGLILEELDTKI